MARGIREYARSRNVPRGIVAAAVSTGAIPLTADGAIDVARAGRADALRQAEAARKGRRRLALLQAAWRRE